MCLNMIVKQLTIYFSWKGLKTAMFNLSALHRVFFPWIHKSKEFLDRLAWILSPGPLSGAFFGRDKTWQQ